MAALGIVAYCFANRPAPPALRSQLPAPTKPLWKPEPGELLTNNRLGLTGSQRKAIAAIAAQWSAEKKRLLSAMKPLAPSRGRMDQVQEQLMDYSLLSRQFNELREMHWSQAVQQLESSQQEAVQP